jgi:chloramphenicol 3-O phosphotransferase
MPEGTGNVIYLNGASSSGKTTIAKELQKAAREPYLHASIDAFLHQLPASILEDHAALARELPRLLAAFNSSSAAIARAGNNVIVDSVLQEPSWVAPCVMAFEGLEVLFVAVRCSLEALENREIERGDRHRGMARYQYDRVHLHGIYDVEVDTSTMPLDACISRILEAARSGRPPSAFRKLRAAGN